MVELQNSPADPAQPGNMPAAVPGTSASAGVFQEADQVLDLADALARGIARLHCREARACRLRLPAYSLLALVQSAGREGLTVSEAAARLDVRPQALSGPVAELTREGLLVRRVDETDARARRLSITKKGSQRLEPATQVRQALLKEILAQIPSPSVAKLVLSRLEMALSRR